jgi:heme A synthase
MFLHAHSGLRYLVLLFGIACLAYALWGLLLRKDYTPRMMSLATLFAVMVHIQFLSGFAVLLSGRFSPALTGHIFMTLMAAAVAQVVSSVMRRKPQEERTYLPHVIGTAVSLALIAAGILAIGRGVFGSGG